MEFGLRMYAAERKHKMWSLMYKEMNEQTSNEEQLVYILMTHQTCFRSESIWKIMTSINQLCKEIYLISI